jgi:hypothetical protein
MARPYFKLSARELESATQKRWHNLDELKVILDELRHRKTKKAISLRNQVIERIKELNDQSSRPNTQNDTPKKGKYSIASESDAPTSAGKKYQKSSTENNEPTKSDLPPKGLTSSRRNSHSDEKKANPGVDS